MDSFKNYSDMSSDSEAINAASSIAKMLAVGKVNSVTITFTDKEKSIKNEQGIEFAYPLEKLMHLLLRFKYMAKLHPVPLTGKIGGLGNITLKHKENKIILYVKNTPLESGETLLLTLSHPGVI